jgi:hypothetical protein
MLLYTRSKGIGPLPEDAGEDAPAPAKAESGGDQPASDTA